MGQLSVGLKQNNASVLVFGKLQVSKFGGRYLAYLSFLLLGSTSICGAFQPYGHRRGTSLCSARLGVRVPELLGRGVGTYGALKHLVVGDYFNVQK